MDGEVVTSMSKRQLIDMRRHIGFVWQEYNLVFRSTVMRNVLAGRFGYNRSLNSLLGIFPSSEATV